MQMMSLRELSSMGWAEIIDNVDAAVFVEDFEGNIHYVNSRASEIFGYSRDEFYGHGIKIIVPEFERGRLSSIRDELRNRGVLEFEAVNISKMGEHVPVKIHAKYSKNGNEELAVITLNDLRPQRKYEKLLSVMSEHINEAIIITDVAGRVLHWNTGAEELFGYTRGEIMGKLFYEYIVPDSERYVRMLSRLNEGNLKHTDVRHVARADFVKKDGTVFHGEVVHSVAKIDDNIYGIAMIKDISEQIASEEEQRSIIERYETILDKMMGGVLILKDEKIVYANPGIIKLTGFSLNEVLGKSIQDYIMEKYKPVVSVNYRRRMMDNTGPEEYLLQVRKKRGGYLWLMVKPTRIKLGDEFADLISMVDITRIKNTEDMLFHFSSVISKIVGIKESTEIYRIIWEEIGQKMGFDAMIFFDASEDGKRVLRFGTDDSKNLDIDCILHGASENAMYIENAEGCGAPDTNIYVVSSDKMEDCNCALLALRKKKEIDADEKKMLQILASHLFLSVKNLQTMKVVERSGNLQELLVRIISHDLKTHLAIIRGYAELLSEKMDPDYIGEINRAVLEAINLIEKTNTFSKLDMEHLKRARETSKIFTLI